MGGTPSKHQATRNGGKACLSHSVSVPTDRTKIQDESSTKASWKSRIYSMSQSYNRGKSGKLDDVMSKLKSVKETEDELDLEDRPGGMKTDEFVNDLGRERLAGTPSVFRSGNGRVLNRCMTFQPAAEAECECRLVGPHTKSSNKGGESVTLGSIPLSSNFPSRDVVMDQTVGLRVLLSPTPSLSQSLVSSSRGAYSPERTVSSRGSFNSMRGNELTKRAFTRVCMDDTFPLEPQWVTAPSALIEMDVPHFDPSILAAVEKAVEDTAHSTWQSLPVIAPEITCLSSKMSEVVKPKPLKEGSRSLLRLKSSRSRAAREERSPANFPQLRTMSSLNRKPSFSKVFSLKNDQRNWSRQDYLDKFKEMCPPGCERKVVLYFTSLRGVRKTFENCFMLRLILKGFRVHVDERDVWMHSKFRQELTDVMGMALSVPRLFVLGRYIGGADDVELLHEEGILSKLLEGLPTECRQVCHVCADIRFIPCTACNGSCKINKLNDITERCSKCNENGLTMCPICD